MMELSPELLEHFRGEGPFDEILNLEGKAYRLHKNRRTLRIERNGRGYFVKIHRRMGWGEVLKNISSLKWPVLSARNEYRAIKKLEALGIDTMRISGFGERGVPPVWLESFIITEELENTVSLEDFCKDWKKNPPEFLFKTALIRKVAGIARTLHQNGVNHRDFYICHFLLDRGKPLSPPLTLYLIDLHRVQVRGSTPERWIIKDLAGLFFSGMDIGLTSHDLFRFMEVYSGKPLRAVLKDEKCFWEQVHFRAAKLYTKEFKRPPADFRQP
jgi:heptose I phosphotransferase